MGTTFWAWATIFIVFLFMWKIPEWQCERDFNVYDCEYEWYPVYGEEIPEEELMP